jgi:hypothetical protein
MDPFCEDATLHSIFTGVTARCNVIADDAQAFKNKILESNI